MWITYFTDFTNNRLNTDTGTCGSQHCEESNSANCQSNNAFDCEESNSSNCQANNAFDCEESNSANC